MSEYVLISEVCNCEDYPCCGHERGAVYPMRKTLALSLKKEGKVRIHGDYHPDTFW